MLNQYRDLISEIRSESLELLFMKMCIIAAYCVNWLFIFIPI